ncbi:NUDIX hydrolase [Actinokineospora sp.]|uniref:NUDIX hydrolase n=1 Tax=Actinokineospora sp. TaxID=1872133 RepID=UPI003D6A9AD7
MPPSSGRSRGARTGRRFRKRGPKLATVDETSAGGLVLDAATGQVALIGRLDRRGRLLWSLPKGHIEPGETPEQTAVREVAEETGIEGEVVQPLGTIDYWFIADGAKRIHKTVHHFLLVAHSYELSDEDLEVTEVAWVAFDDLEARLAYADERRLVRKARQLLSEHPLSPGPVERDEVGRG